MKSLLKYSKSNHVAKISQTSMGNEPEIKQTWTHERNEQWKSSVCCLWRLPPLMIIWQKNKGKYEIAEHCPNFVCAGYQKSIFIFDGYDWKPSTKDMAHLTWTWKHSSWGFIFRWYDLNAIYGTLPVTFW